MKTRPTLRPGQPGTRKLQAFYGDRLVCVRYRYDEATEQRIKTAEIIIDESSWLPSADPAYADKDVQVEVAFHEKSLREKVKAAGGRWDPNQQVWTLPRREVQRLKLQSRVHETEEGSRDEPF